MSVTTSAACACTFVSTTPTFDPSLARGSPPPPPLKVEDEWSLARKQSFVRMATRELHTHQMMRHPRVVKLLDVFELGPFSRTLIGEHISKGHISSCLMLTLVHTHTHPLSRLSTLSPTDPVPRAY